MKHVYLDASAVVKHFRHEPGSEVVDDTIERVSADDSRRLVVSALTTIETLSILNRRRNEAQIPLSVFILSLRGVIRELKSFSHYLVIDDHLILASARYTIKHNINSAAAQHHPGACLDRIALRTRLGRAQKTGDLYRIPPL